MTSPGPRRGPLTLRAGEAEVSLSAADVNALIEAMHGWARTLERRVEQLRHDRPQSLASTEHSLGVLAALEETLVSASPRFADPPVELDPGQAHLLREALNELVSYQRGELPGRLADLKRALHSAR